MNMGSDTFNSRPPTVQRRKSPGASTHTHTYHNVIVIRVGGEEESTGTMAIQGSKLEWRILLAIDVKTTLQVEVFFALVPVVHLVTHACV